MVFARSNLTYWRVNNPGTPSRLQRPNTGCSEQTPLVVTAYLDAVFSGNRAQAFPPAEQFPVPLHRA